MREPPTTTRIRPDGLRYESKEPAHPTFPGGFGATLSCFRCGKHIPRANLEAFALAGKRQFRCRGGCEVA